MSRPWKDKSPSSLEAAYGLGAALDLAQDQADRLDIVSGGAVPTAVLLLATNPTTTDTVTIGGDVYEFVTANGAVADDDNIAVPIGGNAGDSRDNLIAAINGAGLSDGETLIDTVTPALRDGTENVVADEIGTTVRIRPANRPGGTPVGGSPSLALGEALTAGADLWDVGNVNLNTLGGRAAGAFPVSAQAKTLTAGMIANTTRFSFPFAVLGFVAQIRTATGVIRAIDADDIFTIANGDVLATFGGTAAPEAQATDVVTVIAFG